MVGAPMVVSVNRSALAPVATLNRSLPAPRHLAAGYQFADRAALLVARDAWCKDPVVARATYGPIAEWDVSRVSDFSYLFCAYGWSSRYGCNYRCHNLNEDVGSWDTGAATSLLGTFWNAEKFNRSLNWDTSNVVTMESMFRGAAAFNSPFGERWDVSNVEQMYAMFRQAFAFDQPLSKWQMANVRNIRLMFNQAESFNQPLEGWDISSLTDLSGAFSYTTAFDQVPGWDVSGVIRFDDVFRGAEGMHDCTKSRIYAEWSYNPRFTQAPRSLQSLGDDYRDWAELGCYPSLPPSAPTPWIEEQWMEVTAVGVNLLVAAVVVGVLCRIRTLRKRARLREEARWLERFNNFREQSERIVDALQQLPTITYSGGGVELRAAAPSTCAPRAADATRGGGPVGSAIDAVKGLFSPAGTNSSGGSTARTDGSLEAAESGESASAAAGAATTGESTATSAAGYVEDDDDDVRECPICMEAFEVGDELRDLPCKHLFHKSCVDAWFTREARKAMPERINEATLPALPSCPLCKQVPIKLPATPQAAPGAAPAEAVSAPAAQTAAATSPTSRRAASQVHPQAAAASLTS